MRGVGAVKEQETSHIFNMKIWEVPKPSILSRIRSCRGETITSHRLTKDDENPLSLRERVRVGLFSSERWEVRVWREDGSGEF